MEFGINGVSLGHSDSVNASASVPSSQLLRYRPVMRMQRGRHFRKKSSAYLCVDVLTALSRTRRRIVLFSPRYARDHGTGAGATSAEWRENAICT